MRNAAFVIIMMCISGCGSTKTVKTSDSRSNQEQVFSVSQIQTKKDEYRRLFKKAELQGHVLPRSGFPDNEMDVESFVRQMDRKIAELDAFINKNYVATDQLPSVTLAEVRREEETIRAALRKIRTAGKDVAVHWTSPHEQHNPAQLGRIYLRLKQVQKQLNTSK